MGEFFEFFFFFDLLINIQNCLGLKSHYATLFMSSLNLVNSVREEQ